MAILKNTSLQSKVFIGFGIIIVLLLIIAVQAATSLIRADSTFTEYRALARQTNADGRIQAVREELVLNQLNVIGPETERYLTSVMQSAKADGDVEAAYLAGMSLRTLLLARLYVQRFLIQNDEGSDQRVIQEFGELDQRLTELEGSLENTERREWAALARANFIKYADAYKRVHVTINARNAFIRDQLDQIGPMVAGEVERLKLSIKSQQDAMGPLAQTAMDEAVTTTVAVSVIAVIFGIFTVLLLGRGVSRPVLSMS
jgi:methyl-accepting chemotaxis protein